LLEVVTQLPAMISLQLMKRRNRLLEGGPLAFEARQGRGPFTRELCGLFVLHAAELGGNPVRFGPRTFGDRIRLSAGSLQQ
ncbi:MAG: hypothetical protein ACTHJ6_05655, partial [Oryzihumus sp.]